MRFWAKRRHGCCGSRDLREIYLAKKYTVFILLKALPAWLRLAREERGRIADAAFAAAFSEGGISFRHFDAEAFNARASDVAMFETDDLRAYYFAIERLRDTPIFTQPYFELVEILPAIEDGYREFEGR